MSLHRCTVSRPRAASSLRVFRADHLAFELLTCAWPDLSDLRAALRASGHAGVYVLSGFEAGERLVRVGEGSVLWERLPKHKSLAFVQTIHLVASPAFDKASILYLQERLSDLVDAADHARRIGGPPERLAFARAEELEPSLPLLIDLFALAGLTVFAPYEPPSDLHLGRRAAR